MKSKKSPVSAPRAKHMTPTPTDRSVTKAWAIAKGGKLYVDGLGYAIGPKPASLQPLLLELSTRNELIEVEIRVIENKRKKDQK